jgi:hypothetical protein
MSVFRKYVKIDLCQKGAYFKDGEPRTIMDYSFFQKMYYKSSMQKTMSVREIIWFSKGWKERWC